VAEHQPNVRAPVTDSGLVYRRVRIGKALGRIEAARLIPGSWNNLELRRSPDRWHCDISMDNGLTVKAWLDQIEVLPK
jgi:hypothetical protein